MIVNEIKDIEKKDTRVYYLETYIATAVYTFLGDEKTGKIEFSIEQKPTGELDLKIEFIDKIDYPILQTKMELRKHINNLIEKNLLP